MSTTAGHRIAEVARITGFPPATLRYYEDLGLMPATARTEAGYRVYDDRAVERLRFIARAKEIGCSLPEIGELVEAWDGDRCGPVQERLRELVAARLDETRGRIAELVKWTADLERTSTALSEAEPGPGPCDDGCACMQPAPGAAPIACTLQAGELPGRLAEWDKLLSLAGSRAPIPGGARIEFTSPAQLADITRLAAAEQNCCRFFSFAITIDSRGVGLEITAPPEGQQVIAALLGSG